MKVTLNWLRQYVDFDWSPEETAERLTMLGLEVEAVQRIGGEFDGVVVAQVVTKDKHPNADKLTVCRVNDGQGERQIVCGAQNFQAGDKVPLILPGASLPPKPGEKSPFTIKVGKIRGVESQGMMCSPQELGLPDRVDGLLILRSDAKVGQSFAEYLGRAGSDVVFDLEVTPNRPDLNSVVGIAREIAAVTGHALKLPQWPELPAGTRPVSELVTVQLDDPALCPRYTARVVTGVKVAPSPDWLRSTLEKVGIRSINNVVDVTNYVMLETGQPLHAFDYHLIAANRNARPAIIVRRARAGEQFQTLDGNNRSLSEDMLLIADEAKGIALAGVMGGVNTEINHQTVDVLIESAYFAATSIRRTSKQLGLRTESSYRFERGADIGICEWASHRCAQLILQTAGGHLASGVVDAYPKVATARQIALRHRKVNELLGINLDPLEMESYLAQLGLQAVSRQPRPVESNTLPEPALFRVPTWRVDLKREADLIEEIERLHGLDRIPATPPRGAIGSNSFDATHDQIATARTILVGLGLNEAQGQTLVSGLECQAFCPVSLPLANPLSTDMDVLRPTLLLGLLHAVRHNIAHKNYEVTLFEVGRVFHAGSSGCQERRHLAIAITGQRNSPFWCGAERGSKLDVFDLKGLIEEFLDQFGIRGVSFMPRGDSSPLYLESATITLGGKLPLGEFGQLSPNLAKRYDVRDIVLLAELNLDELITRRNSSKSFKPVPQFPAIRRDIAILVPESITHEDVLQAVRRAKLAGLESVQLFDVFRGKHVPPGQKSLAYALTYRSAEKTLTDAEVNAAHQRMVEAMKSQLHAVVRE